MKKKSGFERFFTEKKGAAKKEQFRQEKRKFKKEREESIEKRKQQAIDKSRPTIQRKPTETLMPLNKYIAHSGICSRRDAVELIKDGKVKLNGELIKEPGHKVSSKDTVIVNGKKIQPVKELYYILLNKPKDYITTTEDERGRKTVLDLIKKSS